MKNIVLKTIILIVKLSIIGLWFLTRPFKNYRMVIVDGGRINPLVITPEYLLRRDEVHAKQNVYYILLTENFANFEWVKIVRLYMHIYRVPTSFLHILKSAFVKEGQFAGLVYEYVLADQLGDVFGQTSNKIKLPNYVETAGLEYLASQGISTGDWFVCFANRDSAYLDKAFPDKDWTYHDYRDNSIENLIPAMNFIVEQGGYALRVGAVIETPLAENISPKIIDYAACHRTELLDIYLLKNCRFFVVGNTGISALSSVFDVPCIMTDLIPHSHTDPIRTFDLFINKTLWSEETKKILTYDECYSLGTFHRGIDTGTSEFYIRNKLKLIENSPEDVLVMTKEIFRKIKSGLLELQSERQTQYKEKFRSHLKHYNYLGNISDGFIEKYKHLINLD